MLRAASCSICTDFYNENDIIVNTRCGHVFHEHCFNNWKQCSSNCAQCRAHVTRGFRVYLNFENIEKDATVGSRDVQLNSLKDKLKEKDNQLEILTKHLKTLTEQRGKENIINENIKLIGDLVTNLTDNINALKQYNNSATSLVSPQANSSALLQDTSHNSNESLLDSESSTELDESSTNSDENSTGSVENESLNYRQRLFNYAKNLKGYGYKSVYIHNGRVVVRKYRNSQPIYIINRNHIKELIRDEQDNEDEDAY